MDVAYLNMYEAAKGVADGVLEAPSNVVPAYDDLYPLPSGRLWYEDSWVWELPTILLISIPHQIGKIFGIQK
jgi:hypothetical protein